MRKKFIPEDINKYKVFVTAAGKYGITTWDRKHVFPPKCLTIPDIESLEDLGYTFVRLQSGYNIIDECGQLLLNENVSDIGWLIRGETIGFVKNDGTENLFFVRNNCYVCNITDISFEDNFLQTFRGKLIGLATYSGVEVFKPKYSAVATFTNNIFIAYSNDGKMFLNAPEWDSMTKSAEDFKCMRAGILAKYTSGEYAWINPHTGKDMKENELTGMQLNLLLFAREKEKYQ